MNIGKGLALPHCGHRAPRYRSCATCRYRSRIKQQGDIDIDALDKQLPHDLEPLFRAGDFYHDIWKPDLGNQGPGLRYALLHLEGKLRVELYGHKAVFMGSLLVHRQQQCARIADVLHGDCMVDSLGRCALRRPAA